MKYFWSLVFILALSWTWKVSNAESEYTIEDNIKAENNFAEMIVNTIKERRPNVTDVHFLQLFTEVIDPGKLMNAHFKYEIVESTATGDQANQVISGTAKLKSNDMGESWIVDLPQNISNDIEFKNGTKITPLKEGKEVE